jgi:hypothetical protein
VPDLPFRTARVDVDVQVPVAVVALVECIVKVSEIACGFDAWATIGTAAAAAKIVSVAIVRFMCPLPCDLLRGAPPPALPSSHVFCLFCYFASKSATVGAITEL